MVCQLRIIFNTSEKLAKKEYATEIICDIHRLKHLLSGALQKKFTDPCSNWTLPLKTKQTNNKHKNKTKKIEVKGMYVFTQGNPVHGDQFGAWTHFFDSWLHAPAAILYFLSCFSFSGLLPNNKNDYPRKDNTIILNICSTSILKSLRHLNLSELILPVQELFLDINWTMT